MSNSNTRVYPYKRNIRSKQTPKGEGVGNVALNINSFFSEEIRQALSIKILVLSIIGFLMGRALIIGELMPFGVAFLAAVTMLNRRGSLMVGFFVAAGLATVANGEQLVMSLLNLVALSVLLRYLNLEEKQRWFALPLLVFSLTVIVKTLFIALLDPNFYNYIVVLFEAFIAALLSVVFLVALKPIENQEWHLFKTNEQIICTFILLTGVVVGLGEIQIGIFSLKNIISRFIVMIAALLGSASLGALAGTIVGLIPSIGTMVAPTIIGLYAFAGLMAGLFRKFGKLGVTLGFLLGNILLSIYFTSTNNLMASLGESLFAALAVLIVPNRFLANIKEGCKGIFPVSMERQSKQTLDYAGERIKQISKVFTELSRTFAQISCETEVKEDQSFKVFMDGVTYKVCSKCPKEGHCWKEGELYKTYKGFLEAFTLLEQGQVLKMNTLSDDLHRVCNRQSELVLALNSTYETYKVNHFWQNKLVESRDIVSEQLRGVSAVMDNLAVELDVEPEALEFEDQKPLFNMEIGVAKVGKGGSVVSGDNYSTIELKGNKWAVVLSDGMGVGPKAAMESKAVISLLKQLMKSGISKDVAVKTVNSVLLLRSTEESFATVDLAVLDLNSAETDFLKIGAAPSFIKRNNKVGTIKSSSLPIGILNNIQMDTIQKVLQSGDILVMVTDGVLDSRQEHSDKEDWIIDFLENLMIDDPQDIADLILWHAKNNSGGRILDDMTVLVVKLEVTDEV